MANNNRKKKVTRKLRKLGGRAKRLGVGAKAALKKRWSAYALRKKEEGEMKKRLREAERKAERRAYVEEAQRQARLRGAVRGREKARKVRKPRFKLKPMRLVDLLGTSSAIYGDTRTRKVSSVSEIMFGGIIQPTGVAQIILGSAKTRKKRRK